MKLSLLTKTEIAGSQAGGRVIKLSLLIKTGSVGSQAGGRVDFWKVGKLNHNKAVEQSVDWPRFRDAATTLLEHYGCKYYIKEDLRKVS